MQLKQLKHLLNSLKNVLKNRIFLVFVFVCIIFSCEKNNNELQIQLSSTSSLKEPSFNELEEHSHVLRIYWDKALSINIGIADERFLIYTIHLRRKGSILQFVDIIKTYSFGYDPYSRRYFIRDLTVEGKDRETYFQSREEFESAMLNPIILPLHIPSYSGEVVVRVQAEIPYLRKTSVFQNWFGILNSSEIMAINEAIFTL